jgi:cytochrome c oxidase accessory protein FixG
MATPSLESLATIREDGSRAFVHPADVNGRFTRWRKIVFAFLIMLYVALPWIPIRGEPAVFLNVAERKFHLFGVTFAPQDLWLVFFLISGVGFGLFYLTALFGRVWCGWACPQTVWLDGVYRRIERWIDGDANRRRKLDEAPWTSGKILLRTVKHGAYILVSLFIAHVFMSYFVSIPGLYAMAQASPLENWTVFLWVFVTAGILYFNFAWFREQLCIVICPYGRLQSALIDDDSIVIGYDERRGEPRGKKGTAGAGDCVDCFRCVTVCPTAIDIRQGLQMECIGCSACIDACDDVMTRLNRPTGLIRYDSMNGLAGKPKRLVRPRTIVYSLLLLLGASIFTISLSRLQAFNGTVFRMPGAPYYQQEEMVRNHYQVHIVNKRHEAVHFRISVEGGNHAITWTTPAEVMELAPLEEKTTPVFVSLPRAVFQESFNLIITIESESGGRQIVRTVSFLGPQT